MLDAVINLKDNFSETLKTVESNVSQFSRTSKTMGRDIQRTGRSVSAVGGTLTKTMTMPLLAMGAGAIKVGMEFESSMSEVAATMGITVEEIENGSESFEILQNAAKEMGATTQFSASEAAEALNYLALAGYDAEKSAEMLPKVLNLAAAGGLDLAYASDLVTDSMSALSLSTGEADRFIDEMAKTAQSSNTDVAQLGEAILTVGANGKDLANGTRELNTAIGLLGNAGIKGAEAGTKLRNIIMAMNPTTDAAAAAFKGLETSAYDAYGNLRPLNETLLDMSKGMEGLSMKEKQDIMGGIFNKQDMAAAATLLASVTQSTDDLDFALSEMGISTKDMNMNLEDMLPILEQAGDKQEFVKHTMDNFGASAEEAEAIYSGLMGVLGDESAWDDLEGKINNAEGTAQEMADTLMHNLKGAFTKIKSALEGVGIKIYEILLPALESGAEYVQKFVDKVNNLTPEQTEMIGKFVKMAIVIGPVLSLIGKMTIGAGKLVEEFGFLAGRIGDGGFLKAIFTPGVKVVLILGAIVAAGVLVYKNWDTIKEKASELKERFAWVGDAAKDVRDKFVEFKDKIIELKNGFIDFKDNALETTREKFGQFKEMLKENEDTIETVAGILLTVFGPALLVSGTQALISGTKIIAGFVSSLIVTGAQAVVSGAQLLGSFLVHVVSAGAQAVISGTQIIVSFVGSLITTGVQAVVTGAQITASLIGALISYAAQGVITVASITAQTVAWIAQKTVMIASATASGVMTAAQWALNVAMSANPIALVIGLIVGLIAIFIALSGDTDALKTKMSEAWSGIKSSVTTAIDGITTAWNNLKEFMKNPIKGTVNAVKKGVGWAKDKIGNNYMGTDNWRGGPTWVHEKGPEIIDLPSGTRIYPHAKSLEMAKQQGADSVRRNAEQVRTIIQPIARTASSHAPGITDIGQWIKQGVAPANNIQQPVEKPMKPKIMPINSEVPSRVEKPEKKERRPILIEKLAETIVVREDADIDKITKAIVKELEKVELNMA